MSLVLPETLLQGRRSQPQQLIEVLHDIQELRGYIPQESMIALSKELGVPLIDVYRVASFYKAFSLVPRGEHLVTVCMGTACHVRGAAPMVHQLAGQLEVEPGGTTTDGLFTLECVNCLGACALGPIVVLDGVYHDHMTPRRLRRLIESVRRAENEGRSNV
ncbi:MAG: NAD(P)H-dependent oxidoreductase subunit E [Armatimonadota bacterium]|nr:MAG: NAD(P)H-dependent oxidoreductase subunit E [Armatimonadota bacterium]